MVSLADGSMFAMSEYSSVSLPPRGRMSDHALLLPGTLRMHFHVNDPVKLLKVTPRGALVVTAQGITSVLFPKDQPSSSGGSVLRPELVETTCQGLDGSINLSAAWAVSDHGAPQYDRVSNPP